MLIRELLYTKWKEYEGSQILSLILKSLVMMRIFQRVTSVFLRYFKADCWSSGKIFNIKKMVLLLKKEKQLIFLWLNKSFLRES